MAPDEEANEPEAAAPVADGEGARNERVAGASAGDEWASAGMNDLLAQIGAASEALDEVASEAADVIIEGSSAGGAVTVQLTGSLEAVSVHIDPQLVDPSEVAMLEDAVLAAFRDALAHAVEFREELEEELEDTGVDLSALVGRLSGQLSSLGLPDLGSGRSPEDLIAGLTGALGSLPGGLGGSLGGGLPNLEDLMAGLGLSPPASQSPRARGGPQGAPDAGDDDKEEGEPGGAHASEGPS